MSSDEWAALIDRDVRCDEIAPALSGIAASGPGVCARCWTFDDPARPLCGRCASLPDLLDVVVPISYAQTGTTFGTTLRGYKDAYFEQARFEFGSRLTAVLSRFLDLHEGCIARAAGVECFDVLTVVPRSTPERDEDRPGLRVMADLAERLRTPGTSRFERVLRPVPGAAEGRFFSPGRYVASDVRDRRVLLIDDVWTSGSQAASAAAALRAAGATVVACVVLGRWLRPDWGTDTDWGPVADVHRQLAPPFSWQTCAVHASA